MDQDAMAGGSPPADANPPDQPPPAPDAQTVLVDKSVFGEKVPAPGARLTFEFVRAYEDEAELKLVSDEKSSPESGVSNSDADLESLAT